jgi:hypothetical protein
VAASTWEGFYIPSPNRMATFTLLDTAFNFVVVRADGANLRLWSLQTPEIRLTPVAGSLYRRDDRVTASHALSLTNDDQRLLSTAAQTYQQAPLGRLVLLWTSLAIGLLGWAYLVVVGLFRVVGRRITPSHPAFLPVVGCLALLLPVPLFYRQPFLAMGDLTLASGTLAAVTGFLPPAMVFGLAFSWRRNDWHTSAVLDVAAMVGVLQLAAVLAVWGLLPLTLWV